MGTKQIYEILGIEVSGQLGARETSSDKRQAMILAKEWSKKYHRVEVNSLILDRDNADYVGDELIAAWENGKKDNKMTRLEKMIGFPVPQEHRKELNERLNTYENCDRTTLISLLLQYDWELLQMAERTKGDIYATVFRKRDTLSIQEVVQRSIDAAIAPKHLAQIYKLHNEEFVEKAVEWFRHQKEEIGISWFDDYEIRFREAMEEQ